LSAITFSSDQSSTGSTSAPAAQSAQAQTSGARGMTAFRDPDTGELREPTADEAAALANQSVQEASVPEPIVSAQGFSGLRLGDDQMTFTVATRSTDGTIAIQHATGKRAAEQKVRDNAVPRGLVAGKESVLER
jgi:hypothetical protein